jgi:cytochrome c556
MKNIFKSGIIAAALGTLLVANASAMTEASSQKHAQTAVKYRQSVFQLVRSNMGPLGGMAKGAIPYDTDVMSTNAVRLEQLADMMADYLLVDTRKFGVDTDAKDAMFDNESDVLMKIDALRTASIQLQTAVKSGDVSGYQTAIGAIGSSCKSCHDDYKKD